MLIDTRALEEIGIDQEIGVSIDLENVPASDFLAIMLRDLDLALDIQLNVLAVTTREAAGNDLLGRIYWLEGINVAGDYDSLINLIQTTIVPETWEALGGNSTIAPFGNTRPAIVVSTTYDVHGRVEELISALRRNSFSRDAKPVDVEVPATDPPPGGLGGGGLGGVGEKGGGGFF